MKKTEFEIPLEEYNKKAAPIVAALYDLECPDVECPDCPVYIPTPQIGPYLGCMICCLQERINPEVKP
jgi:hypothetical protein